MYALLLPSKPDIKGIDPIYATQLDVLARNSLAVYKKLKKYSKKEK
jgi:hypothetical protein